jgi:hypothetical protein
VLRHIFLAHTRSDVASDDVDQLIAAWRAFPASIAEIRSLTAGRNVSSEDLRYSVALVADFADGDEWRRFMDHPAHLAVRTTISERVLDPATRVTVQYII